MFVGCTCGEGLHLPLLVPRETAARLANSATLLSLLSAQSSRFAALSPHPQQPPLGPAIPRLTHSPARCLPTERSGYERLRRMCQTVRWSITPCAASAYLAAPPTQTTQDWPRPAWCCERSQFGTPRFAGADRDPVRQALTGLSNIFAAAPPSSSVTDPVTDPVSGPW